MLQEADAMLFLDYTPELTNTELSIYHYITRNIDVAQHLTIRELADLNFVSTTTILRFCNKFECNGYAEFKARLRNHMNQSKETQFYDLDETALVSFISNTNSEFFNEKLKGAVQLILESDFVVFLGLGTSNMTAEYGASYFRALHTLAFNMDFLLENPEHRSQSESYIENACIIALSVNGENTKIINNVSQFKRHQVPIISITNSAKCTLSSLSDINIPYYISNEKILTADITSQIPAIFIIEKLAKEVASIKKSL